MKADAVGKTYSEVQCAYLAGFIDGDGAIMATIERHTEKKFGVRIRVTLKITQRDQAPCEWLAKTYGVGRVRANRMTTEWIIRDQRDVRSLLSNIEPYALVKKRQVQLARKILALTVGSKQDLARAAHWADALAGYNVRSKNRRKNYASMIQE